MASRRRRQRLTWFPLIGTERGGTAGNANWLEFSMLVPGSGAAALEITPVVPDSPLEPADQSPSNPGQLVQQLGQEYFIKRIVGKCHAGLQQNALASSPTSVIFGAGLFIARCNDQAPNQPIGALTPAEAVGNYDVFDPDTLREPWIWRRSWVFGNSALATETNTPGGGNFAWFPYNTGWWGSALTGGHIDAKTGRRVGNDERLFLAVSARTIPTGVVFDTDAAVNGIFDLRVLGALRRAKARSAF